MITKLIVVIIPTLALFSVLAGCATMQHPDPSGSISISPSSMPQIGTIDERYQSYNVEMLEVTGGTFWKPYAVSATPLPGHRLRQAILPTFRQG